jgi:hypothetical protein
VSTRKPAPKKATTSNLSSSNGKILSLHSGGLGPEPVRLAIKSIAKDRKFQVRKKLDGATVKRYENNYRTGHEMPPVKVAMVDGVPILVDGWHRVQALENLGAGHVEAEVQRATRREAHWLAASANLSHGLPLKQSELREVFRAYIKAERHIRPKGNLKSYREIAADLGKPHGTIYNWMRKDFPRVAAKLSGYEGGVGGLQEGPSAQASSHVISARAAMAQLTTAFSATSDANERGTIIDELEAALSEMKGSGNWSEPDY